MKLKSFKPSFYIVGYPMEPDVRQEALGGSLFLFFPERVVNPASKVSPMVLIM
jgi:hypothetical protein